MRTIKEKSNISFSMIVGAIGTILIALTAMKLISSYHSSWYLVAFLGFIFINHRIMALERKTGIPNKIIWAKSFISIIVFVISAFILFV